MQVAAAPKYLPFIEVLGNRLFRIPEYQRAYSWTDEQITDLFGDIDKTYENSKDSGMHHFMATIVSLNTAEKEELGSSELPVLHVVDGQ